MPCVGAGSPFRESHGDDGRRNGLDIIVVLRIGTAIMHIANTGLMGWALVGAWRGRDALWLALVYAGAMLVTVPGISCALSYG